MVVKYKALWSLVIYASTLPLIILTILNLLKPNIDFDFTFIGGTLAYVILTLRHIKHEIIQKLSKRSFKWFFIIFIFNQKFNIEICI